MYLCGWTTLIIRGITTHCALYPYTPIPTPPKLTSDIFEFDMTPLPSEIELFHPYPLKVQLNWRTTQKDWTETQPTQTFVESLLMQSGFTRGGTNTLPENDTLNVTVQDDPNTAPSLPHGLGFAKRLPTLPALPLHYPSPSP